MSNNLMTGVWRLMLNVPPFLWEKQIKVARKKILNELTFMSAEHRQVHHFAVRELPGIARPLTPEQISESMGMPVDRVRSILDDLEKHMTFLFRDDSGAVIWAYPVTFEKTPHHLSFSSGEHIYAA